MFMLVIQLVNLYFFYFFVLHAFNKLIIHHYIMLFPFSSFFFTYIVSHIMVFHSAKPYLHTQFTNYLIVKE